MERERERGGRRYAERATLEQDRSKTTKPLGSAHTFKASSPLVYILHNMRRLLFILFRTQYCGAPKFGDHRNCLALDVYLVR